MPDTRSIKLADTYDAFILDRKAQRFKTHTIKTYEDRLYKFVNWCIENKSITLADLTPLIIKKYLVTLQDRNLSGTTVHGIAICIQTFCNWLVTEEIVTDSPMKKVKIPKVDKKILPAFTNEDVKALLKTVSSERDEAIILFLLDTGLRATELINLKAQDIDLKTGVVSVRLGKGGKDRIVYIGNRTRKQLLRYYMERKTPEPNDYVWLSERTTKPIKTVGLRQILARLGREAKVKHCSPHTFRRTFALTSLKNGMSIFHLQRLMGHADIHVLKQYLDLSQSDLKDSAQKHGVVDNM